MVDKFLADEERLLRTLDTIDSAEKTDEFVKLDANSMFAGSKLLIELELVNIETLD